ncbi:MAG TPA: CHC2 zinc finger domain-containing protein, partial [Nitrospirota bacterium]
MDRVRSSVDIVDIVSEKVKLKRSGANYMGLCPFHSEKTPSFTVSPAKQIFHCFGCGAGGDALEFLIRSENFSFPDAIRRLADRVGIEIPEHGVSQADKAELDAIYTANEVADEYFRDCLKDRKAGEKARQYLESRGMMDAADTFGIGFAPGSWDGMVKALAKAKIKPDISEKAGLTSRKEDGS